MYLAFEITKNAIYMQNSDSNSISDCFGLGKS